MNTKIFSLLLSAVMAGTVGYAQNVTTVRNVRSVSASTQKASVLTVNPAVKKSDAQVKTVVPVKASSTKIAPQARMKVNPKAKVNSAQPLAVPANRKISRVK